MYKHKIIGLADRGYSHPYLLSPARKPASSLLTEEERGKIHSDHRSPVENINALVKNWRFADARVKSGPEMQALGLFVIYALVNK